MIGFVVLLAAVAGGFAGRAVGPIRALTGAAAAFLAALAAVNWGLPFADALQPGSPGAAGFLFVVTFVAITVGLTVAAVWAAPDAGRAPWLLADLAGGGGGALFGWLTVGVLVLALRLQPGFNAMVENGRRDQTVVLGAPDDFLLRVFESGSQSGLQRQPARPFERRANFLERGKPRD